MSFSFKLCKLCAITFVESVHVRREYNFKTTSSHKNKGKPKAVSYLKKNLTLTLALEKAISGPSNEILEFNAHVITALSE